MAILLYARAERGESVMSKPVVSVSVDFGRVLAALKAKRFQRSVKPGEAKPGEYTHVRDQYICSWEELVQQINQAWRAEHDGESVAQVEVFENLLYLSEYKIDPDSKDEE